MVGAIFDAQHRGSPSYESERGRRRFVDRPIVLRVLLAAAATLFSRGASAYAVSAGDAVKYYAKALRGAANLSPDGGSSATFQRLARLHYKAVLFRRKGDFTKASIVYQHAMEFHGRQTPKSDEVPRAAVAAHAALNLALTEQARKNIETARQTFQDGVAQVQEILRSEHQAWIDSCNQIRLCCSSAGTQQQFAADGLRPALQWLATLLTAWALMETKHGRVLAGRQLCARAAQLDSSKAQVLRWNCMHPSRDEEAVAGAPVACREP
mmetsp:Transcript_82990/g.216294  ORF Transcript_82990/g.216294 Transcript_82990/m.216294 type:complete len:267 (+) Transcript_82990:56-856(+)